MSEFKSKVGKPVLISNIDVEKGLDIFSLRVGVYEGYIGGKNPYKFYDFNESHSLGFLRKSGLWLNTLRGVKTRPRQECLFYLKDIDTYVDYKVDKWVKEFSQGKKLVTTPDSIEDGAYFMIVNTNFITTLKVGVSRIWSNNGVYKASTFSGSKQSLYNDLKEDRRGYFFTSSDITRLKEDIKEMYRNLDKEYSKKVKSFEITKEGYMIVNGSRIV